MITGYVLIQDQEFKESTESVYSIPISARTGTRLRRSSSLNRFYNKMCILRRNIETSMQHRRETRKEKRPQDGKTNPFE